MEHTCAVLTGILVHLTSPRETDVIAPYVVLTVDRLLAGRILVAFQRVRVDLCLAPVLAVLWVAIHLHSDARECLSLATCDSKTISMFSFLTPLTP